jgi:hypothetical protein
MLISITATVAIIAELIRASGDNQNSL